MVDLCKIIDVTMSFEKCLELQFDKLLLDYAVCTENTKPPALPCCFRLSISGVG